MSNLEEKRYYIDPGKGMKKHYCPYSRYEDGRDVVEDIIPPKGYVLTGFKFIPQCSDKRYDGKLIAEYEKMSFSDKLRQNLSKYVLIMLLVMVTFIFLSIFEIFPKSKPKIIVPDRPQIANEVATIDSTLVDNSPTTQPEALPKTEIKSPSAKEKEKEVTSPTKPAVSPTPKVETNDPADQFNQEFWKLIHKQEKNMNTYYTLYGKYKDKKLKSEEYFYLYLTILKNTAGFNAWKAKFVQVPSNEIKSISTISELTEKLKEYE